MILSTAPVPSPRVSIITVNLNNKSGLERTIGSILSQTFTGFEFIVVDGGSKDGSVEMLGAYKTKIDRLISEPDAGVYAAMNKGIGLARGEYCYFLNSGDNFCNAGCLEEVFAKSQGEDIVYGNMIHGGKETVEPGLKEIRFFDFFIGSIFHQAALIKRSLFDSVGLYNENHRVVSDWEFFLKAIFLHRCTYAYVDVQIARYEPGGMSFQNQSRNDAERAEVLGRLFPLFISDYEDLKKFRLSDLSGIHKAVENKSILRVPLTLMIRFSRFIRFRILRQSY